MKLIIIRHGDPDYEHDSLTQKGVREAQLLSDRISQLDVKAFYCSPLGRAQDTASYTLNKMNRTAETLPWLCEFEGKIVSGLKLVSGTDYRAFGLNIQSIMIMIIGISLKLCVTVQLNANIKMCAKVLMNC